MDFGAHRVFDIKERLKLQFRSEFFDFFNNAEFNNPNTTVTNSKLWTHHQRSQSPNHPICA